MAPRPASRRPRRPRRRRLLHHPAVGGPADPARRRGKGGRREALRAQRLWARRAGVRRHGSSRDRKFPFPLTIPGPSTDSPQKEDVLNHVKAINLPYTSIDVGWWYQNTLPSLPSGKIDYAVKFPLSTIYATGDLPTSLTDLRDIGLYVARILADPRTLDASVFVHNEVRTQEQILSLLERLADEKVPRTYRSAEDLRAAVAEAQAAYDADPSWARLLGVAVLQYPYSVWVRGDNLPASAAALGYLDGKELYPDLEDQLIKYDDYVAEVVAGNGKAPYANRTFG